MLVPDIPEHQEALVQVLLQHVIPALLVSPVIAKVVLHVITYVHQAHIHIAQFLMQP